MICPNCNSSLKDDAKFCTTCGEKIIVEDIVNADIIPTPSNEVPIVQQPLPPQEFYNQTIYGNPQALYGQMHYNVPPRKSLTAMLLPVIVIVFLLVVILGLLATNQNLNNEISDYKNTIYQYENENPIDKTFDAVDSWADFIEPFLP